MEDEKDTSTTCSEGDRRFTNTSTEDWCSPLRLSARGLLVATGSNRLEHAEVGFSRQKEMLFGEEPGFPSLSAAWSYIQNLFEPESPESKDTLEKEIVPWFAGESEFYHLLAFLKDSLTVGSPAWPHMQSEGDLVIERLRTLAQALVWAQKTLVFQVASSTSLRHLCILTLK